MKYLFSLLTLCLVLSCSKNDENLDDVIPINSENILRSEGSFKSSAHPTSGVAQIIEGPSKKYLQIKNLNSDNGPDLFVYLSADLNASDFKNLGDLKSTNGNFYYEFDKSIDHTKYNKVLIWCRAFSVNFGYAELQ